MNFVFGRFFDWTFLSKIIFSIFKLLGRRNNIIINEINIILCEKPFGCLERLKSNRRVYYYNNNNLLILLYGRCAARLNQTFNYVQSDQTSRGPIKDNIRNRQSDCGGGATVTRDRIPRLCIPTIIITNRRRRLAAWIQGDRDNAL